VLDRPPTFPKCFRPDVPSTSLPFPLPFLSRSFSTFFLPVPQTFSFLFQSVCVYSGVAWCFFYPTFRAVLDLVQPSCRFLRLSVNVLNFPFRLPLSPNSFFTVNPIVTPVPGVRISLERLPPPSSPPHTEYQVPLPSRPAPPLTPYVAEGSRKCLTSFDFPRSFL